MKFIYEFSPYLKDTKINFLTLFREIILSALRIIIIPQIQNTGLLSFNSGDTYSNHWNEKGKASMHFTTVLTCGEKGSARRSGCFNPVYNRYNFTVTPLRLKTVSKKGILLAKGLFQGMKPL
jgi:hypothetical protein